MPCSPARLEANRLNSQKSTGPRSAQGRATSRKNSLKHGLTAKTLLSPQEVAATEGMGPVALHVATEIVLLTTRIELAQQVEERERGLASMRATQCWEEDRAADAERLAARLAKRPEKVARQLRQTIQGCELMIGRWEMLREAAAQPGGWTEIHQALAFDLQGIPLHYRFVPTPAAQQNAVVDREVHALQVLQSQLIPCDAFERDSARQGLSNTASPGLRNAIRYEAALTRRLQWCLKHAPRRADETKPTPTPAPSPEPVVKAPILDFDQDFDLPFSRQPFSMDTVEPVLMVSAGKRPAPR